MMVLTCSRLLHSLLDLSSHAVPAGRPVEDHRSDECHAAGGGVHTLVPQLGGGRGVIARPLGAGANGVEAEGTTARFGKIVVSRPGDEERDGPC